MPTSVVQRRILTWSHNQIMQKQYLLILEINHLYLKQTKYTDNINIYFFLNYTVDSFQIGNMLSNSTSHVSPQTMANQNYVVGCNSCIFLNQKRGISSWKKYYYSSKVKNIKIVTHKKNVLVKLWMNPHYCIFSTIKVYYSVKTK